MLRRLVVAAALAGAAAAVVAGGEAGPDGVRLGAWPPRAPLSAPRGDPFAAPARPRAAAPPAAAPRAAAPATPPMPYRVAGSVVIDGVRQVLLAKGDALFPVTEGDTLEGDYRVESIGGDELILVYRPLGVRESLPLAGDASAARIAAYAGWARARTGGTAF